MAMRSAPDLSTLGEDSGEPWASVLSLLSIERTSSEARVSGRPRCGAEVVPNVSEGGGGVSRVGVRPSVALVVVPACTSCWPQVAGCCLAAARRASDMSPAATDAAGMGGAAWGDSRSAASPAPCGPMARGADEKVARSAAAARAAEVVTGKDGPWPQRLAAFGAHRLGPAAAVALPGGVVAVGDGVLLGQRATQQQGRRYIGGHASRASAHKEGHLVRKGVQTLVCRRGGSR